MCPIWVLGALLFLAGCAPHGVEALRQGDQALEQGRPEEAVPLLEQAVTDLPNNALAWNHLGLAYQGIGRPEEARKAYLRALEFDRNLFDVHFNLGALEFEAGRWPEAERSLRTYLGLEQNRTNVAAWRLLGEAQLATQQFDAAERTLSIAVQLAPRETSLRNRLGLALAQKRRWRDAQAQFTEIIRQDPTFADAHLNLAVALQQQGDRRGSLERYRAYLALNPPSPQAEIVRLQVQQLDLLLNPPSVVLTNATLPKPAPVTNVVRTLPPAVTPTNIVRTAPTNVVRPPPTNVVVAPPRTTSPPPVARITNAAPPAAVVRVATNPPVVPATNPPPKPAEPVSLPLEVVRVEEPLQIQGARDVSPADRRTSVPVTNGVAPDPAEVADSAEKAPASNAESTTSSRRTFWQRVNPVAWGNPMKWFRGDDDTNRPPVVAAAPAPTPTPASTPLRTAAPPPATTLPVPAPTATNAVAERTPVRTPQPKPVVARYKPYPMPALTPGNRAAAEAATLPATTDRLTQWQRAVQLDPSWSVGWQQLGRLAMESGRTDLALIASEAAVTLEPKSAPAHQLFAAALAKAGYPADAADQLEQALSLAPGSAQAHLALAGIYARDLAEPDKARPHYERVLILDPQHPQAASIQIWLASQP
ncbi:MAG: tetratricopeptide repeat protein [Verrucomicrobia bacterium]|nr:tetratricopeptide repeat protein [Verrucomicrobiota bacterium]